MAIDVDKPQRSVLDPVVAAELDDYERTVAEYLAGEVDEDVFRVYRLRLGVYGQRQGGRTQMLRIKVPFGRLTADQLDTIAHVVDEYCEGPAHLTTRQNVQVYSVELARTPDALRALAAVGLTSRESGGDVVRNITACPGAGVCPGEVLDVTPWADAVGRHFLRNPIAQRLPRKVKIGFSGCSHDCGQAIFNDIGVIGTQRIGADGSAERGFQVLLAGGLGNSPRAAEVLEPFTSREQLAVTVEAVVRVFDRHGNRDNKNRARMKWLAESLGIDVLREKILSERRFLRGAAGSPQGVPSSVEAVGDVPTTLRPFTDKVNPSAGVHLGDITADQLRAIAALQRALDLDVRITNRQNLKLRGVPGREAARVAGLLGALRLAHPGVEVARDVVSCPGADTCNVGITKSRGLADAIAAALGEAGLADVPGVRINVSGCANACGQHHVADIGLFGLERRPHGTPAPGYELLVGGRLGATEVQFGAKTAKLPARRTPEAVVRIVARFNAERAERESFTQWLDRVGGAPAIAAALSDLDDFPLPAAAPDLYTDFGDSAPFATAAGDSECA